MWSSLINCIESDADIKYKLSFLNTLINVHGINLQHEQDISQVKSKIKELCADITKRTEGLLLLYAVVHCSSTVYVDNWSQVVLGSLKVPDSLISREIPLKVMNRILKNFGHNSDYSEVFDRVIPEILPILLNPENDTIYIFSCQSLSFCMKCVPKVTGTRVADIEKLLLKELGNPYGEVVEAIGDCFAALPMCILHLQGNGPVEYKEIWCNIFKKIINTLHLVMNIILNLSEGQEDYVDVSDFPVYDIPSLEQVDIPLSLCDVFKSLCKCMAKMMSSGNSLVRLPITELLDAMYRIFKVKKIIKDQNKKPRIGYLKLGFPQMLIGAYVVLEALILNFPLIEQSRNFVVLMNMSIDAMEETSFSQSSVSQLRGSTWKLIDVWLKQYGSKGSCDLAKDKTILHEILKDIDIGEKGSMKSKQLEHIPAEDKTNKIYACTHALKVLKSLVETSSCFMEKNNLDDICSALLRISRVMVRCISPSQSFPAPYCDEKCRKLLYDALLCCAVYSDPLHSRCMMEAQNIFNVASRDTSTKVSRICHRFRKLSRYYLNPRKPPPDAMQYSHPSMLNRVQQPVIESVRAEWGNGINWNNVNGPSDDQMVDSEVAQVKGESAYSDKMKSEGDLTTLQQIDNANHINHDYRRIVKQSSQSMGEEDSIDDSDIEPTYVSTDSNPQRIGMNDSSHINSFGIQSCAEECANESRTERHTLEEVVPNLANNVKNNIEEQVTAFIEVKPAAQKPPQVSMGNGEWKKKENSVEIDEEDSDIEEDGDEEGDVNEEVSDNAADEASDGKHSSEFDEERPSKRQKCMDEEGYDDVDEDLEDEDIPLNNQSSDEEESEVNTLPVVEQNTGNNSENLIDEESQDDIEDISCRSPTIRKMCSDFVLAEPTAPEIS